MKRRDLLKLAPVVAVAAVVPAVALNLPKPEGKYYMQWVDYTGIEGNPNAATVITEEAFYGGARGGSMSDSHLVYWDGAFFDEYLSDFL